MSLYQSPAGDITLDEEISAVLLKYPLAYDQQFSAFMGSVSGVLLVKDETSVTYRIPKGGHSKPFFQQLLNIPDLDVLYTMKAVVVAAPAEPQVAPTFINPLTAPSSTAFGGENGKPIYAQGTYEKVQKGPAKLLYQTPDLDYWIYDYSPACITVFVIPQKYAEYKVKFSAIGAKEGKFYPEGNQQGQASQFGWMFFKNNDNMLNFISGMMGSDVRSVLDMAAIPPSKFGNRTATYQAPQSTIFSTNTQMVPGPFGGGGAAAPKPIDLKSTVVDICNRLLNELPNTREQFTQNGLTYYCGPNDDGGIIETLTSGGYQLKTQSYTATHKIICLYRP
jgi:hypothetical protein